MHWTAKLFCFHLKWVPEALKVSNLPTLENSLCTTQASNYQIKTHHGVPIPDTPVFQVKELLAQAEAGIASYTEIESVTPKPCQRHKNNTLLL